MVPSRRSLSGGNSGIKLARHRRQNSADSTGFGVGREHNQRRRLKTPFKLTTREKVERRPLYSSRPRKNAEQRTTPSLYRKRVATMRNVDGWVREVDPSSARRGGHTVDKNSRSDGTPAECPEAKRDSIGGCGIFLTEIGSNNGCSRGLVDAATRNCEKIRARVEGCRADRFGSETDRGVKLAPSAIKPVKNVSREFLKRAKKISYDFRAGDEKRRCRTVKRVVNSIHRTHQQKIPPSTKALFPSRGMNTAIGSLEKRLNWEGASERAFQTTTISDCDWCVGEQPTTLATNDKQSELSSSQGPHAVFSSPVSRERSIARAS